MPGTPHEVVLLAIRENPELFAEVLRRVGGTDVPGPIEVIDSNVRFAASLETRPDLVVRTPNAASKWIIIELQNRKDESKCRSWPLAVSVLLQRDGMGGRRRDHREPQRRHVGQGGGPPPRRAGNQPRADAGGPLAVEGPRLRAPRSSPARARAVRRVGALPRRWPRVPWCREARHRADRGATCPRCGKPRRVRSWQCWASGSWHRSRR